MFFWIYTQFFFEVLKLISIKHKHERVCIRKERLL